MQARRQHLLHPHGCHLADALQPPAVGQRVRTCTTCGARRARNSLAQTLRCPTCDAQLVVPCTAHSSYYVPCQLRNQLRGQRVNPQVPCRSKPKKYDAAECRKVPRPRALQRLLPMLCLDHTTFQAPEPWLSQAYATLVSHIPSPACTSAPFPCLALLQWPGGAGSDTPPSVDKTASAV